MTYVCKTKCFHGGRLYEVGDTAEFSAASVPEHFVPLDAGEPPKEQTEETEKAKKGRATKAAKIK